MHLENTELREQFLACSNKNCSINLETCKKSLKIMASSNKSLSNPISIQKQVEKKDVDDYDSLKFEYESFKQTCFNMTLDAMVNLQNQQLKTSELLSKFNNFHSQ